MEKDTILIVDDNPVNMKLIRILLTGEGYDVRIAADAKEALEVLTEVHPSLILMDIQLPGIDGLGIDAPVESRTDDSRYHDCGSDRLRDEGRRGAHSRRRLRRLYCETNRHQNVARLHQGSLGETRQHKAPLNNPRKPAAQRTK